MLFLKEKKKKEKKGKERKLSTPSLTTCKFIRKKKITELSGIVIILVDDFNKFSFSFMFHLDESAGRKYFKFRL